MYQGERGLVPGVFPAPAGQGPPRGIAEPPPAAPTYPVRGATTGDRRPRPPLRMHSAPASCAQLHKNPRSPRGLRGSGGSDRRRSGDLSIFSRTLYQLSYRARTGTITVWSATPTGLEPATSAVTGRRANQLRYGALQQVRPIELLLFHNCGSRTPNGIRTRVAAVKGRCPRPLDDGGRLAAGLAPEDEDYFRQNMPSRSKRPPVTPNTP